VTSPSEARARSPFARAYFSATCQEFRDATAAEIIGQLSSHSEYSIDTAQRDAWLAEIDILRAAVDGISGTILLEFTVPRIGTRLDAVLIANGIVFALEFKVGAREYLRDDFNQAWDYALDLKNFHKASHGAPIVPILIATAAEDSDAALTTPHPDRVYPPLRCNAHGLRPLLTLALDEIGAEPLDATEWANAPYQPTPTIIEAAQALYSHHSVDAIARHDAGARNLRITSRRVEEIIEEASRLRQKTIIFVTGVPGAGKTLVGLNVTTKKRDTKKSTHAVFLSGNGPLVMVLREALTRDEFDRLKRQEKAAPNDDGAKPRKLRKGDAGQKVKAFIQNVHHFRDAALADDRPPADRVVIFDEAQRAWNQEMTADFMKRKRGQPDFSQSEPEFLISYLDRHEDWAVVVCLVGGGQEINRGEAGISAWLDAIRERFPTWHAYISPELTDNEYAASQALAEIADKPNFQMDNALHLAVSMRSFRAENVSAFVKAVLDNESDIARSVLAKLADKYPIAVTRDLARAKQWIRDHARGSERYGLVASSEAQRLKPHAIDVRYEVNPIHWFLNGRDDTRSSYYMEDAATQFQVQGLELDWVCMTWDADLRYTGGGWQYKSFRGKKWENIHAIERRRYLLNAYRVLLTRARQGMVIFVPPGDVADTTRLPEYYDATFGYLTDLGMTGL
jgi:hypothetical protein